jgi:hypothetical protein
VLIPSGLFMRIKAFSGSKALTLLLALILALILWGNVFRFSPNAIDQVFDPTSEGLVIGRLGRAAAEGIFFKQSGLGTNYDPKHPLTGRELYQAQLEYLRHPETLKTDNVAWSRYGSQLGLQGIVYSFVDALNPLPRQYAVEIYHFLSALICASAFMWVAFLINRRFGFAAFAGFVAPVAVEPMFTALGPNLYWAAGLWFVPMAIAMYLVEAKSRRNRLLLIVAIGAATFAKALCGYEFITTVVCAAMTGCLLNNDVQSRPMRIMADMIWTCVAGLAGFALAFLLHGYAFGFAGILGSAMARTGAGGLSLEEGLLLGHFASVLSVIRTYLGANAYTLIPNFALVLGPLVILAVVTFLDRQFNWFFGNDREKLQALAFAYLASLAAPLSWFILAKAHSFVHTPIDFIVWYVPTVPVGGALALSAIAALGKGLPQWRVSFSRSLLTLLIPLSVVSVIVLVRFLDRRIDEEGKWVLNVHSRATPIFADNEIGVDFRMNDHWFTVEYPCDRTSPSDIFFIHAYRGETISNYDFVMSLRGVLAPGDGKCYYARPRRDDPVTRIVFGVQSKKRTVWLSEKTFAVNDSFVPDPLTDGNWKDGILRATGTTLLLRKLQYVQLSLKAGSVLEFPLSGRRKITDIEFAEPYVRVTFDGKPVTDGDAAAPIRIIREP